MTTPYTPYTTLQAFFPGAKPTWIPDELDQERILSYQIYEQIYWNVPETFKLTWRGTEDKPIYLPSAKTIIDALNRYTAPNMGFTIAPSYINPAVEADVVVAQGLFSDFFKRERFWSKLAGNKWYGLIHGDWCWYIWADPTKIPGSRISIRALDPGTYFPIFDPDDIDSVIGCDIVDQYTPQGSTDVVIKRQRFYKPGKSPTMPTAQFITSQLAMFSPDDWEGVDSKPIGPVAQPEIVVNGITSLPVYHIKNTDEPGNPFGSSDIRGFERIITALNQGISDQELTLAMMGLNMFVTNAPTPTDDENNVVGWTLGPGRVIETPTGGNHTFTNVAGVSSVAPFDSHLTRLQNSLQMGASTPDIAVGAVDVAVAASGVALQLQMSPILSATSVKDQMILDVHSQMFYDLQTQWFPTYEQYQFAGMIVTPTIGDKLPVDRVEAFTELNNMFDRGIISAAYYRAKSAELGYQFPEGMQEEILSEKSAFATAEDPFAAAAANELNGAPPITEDNTTINNGAVV